MLVESFSGIRGLYKEDLDEDTARKYAVSFLDFIKKTAKSPKIVVGVDTRPSSNSLKQAMLEVLDCEIIDVGINTTPAVQLAVRANEADAGIVITASHNEPEYNGFKFLNHTGAVLEPPAIRQVIDNFRHFNKPLKQVENKVKNKTDELIDGYTSFVLHLTGEKGIEDIKNSNFKIIIDPNGGAASVVIKQILKKLNIQTVDLNMNLGEFKRLIEPNKESLSYLIPLIEKHKADLAVGWDCDGDRVEIIDNKGNMVSGQYILALLVDEVLSQSPGKKFIVTNDATSNVVRKTAEKYGAKTIEVEVGEINVVSKMDELKAVVGGEGSSSGGIFPPSRCRDGILSLTIILRLMARKNKKLSELIEELPKYYVYRTDVKCDKDIVEVRKKLEKEFSGFKQQKTGDETGGLKIIFKDDSWLWYRASKTEYGVFRIITDSDSEERAKKLLNRGKVAFDKVVNEN